MSRVGKAGATPGGGRVNVVASPKADRRTARPGVRIAPVTVGIDHDRERRLASGHGRILSGLLRTEQSVSRTQTPSCALEQGGGTTNIGVTALVDLAA
jgi:hypothetical protein